MRFGNGSWALRALIAIAVLNIIALGVVAALLLNRMQAETERNIERQDRLIGEIRRTSDETEDLRAAARSLMEDTGEIREQLGMSRRNYEPLRPRYSEDTGADGRGDEAGAEAQAFFEAFRELLAYQNRLALAQRFRALEQQGVFSEAAQELGLEVRRHDEVHAEQADNRGESGTAERRIELVRDGQVKFRIEPDARAGDLVVRAERSEASAFRVSLDDELDRAALRAYLSEELEEIERLRQARETRVAELARLAESDALASRAGERSHRVRSAEAGNRYEIALELENGTLHEVPSLVFGYRADDNRFVLDDARYDEFESFREALFDELTELTETPPEKETVERSIEMLKRAARDSGFRRLLENHGLRLSTEPRDRGDHLHFDLLELDSEERFGSFAVQRPNGELWIMDDGDVPLQTFRRFGISAGSQRNSSFDPRLGDLQTVETAENAVTAVVLGTNEGVTDSIMLAHADPRSDRIKLISVPRDLFYRGRRVNMVYPRYGPERFARELTEITGLPIDHYIAIDMYAFIEAVNILGGVEVTLEEDLIDPSYRTRDDGEWGTLYYPRGTHLLSGIEALRVARSRATTDDFDRAARQQRVVGAVFEKLSALQLQNIGTLHELVATLTRYVETDLSPFQMIRYLQRFGGYDIGTRTVIDTSNVLYHTYSNLYYSNKSADEVDEDFNMGAWILLPENDDWNAIRRYVEQVVNGEEA